MYDLNLVLYIIFGVPLIAAFIQMGYEIIAEHVWRKQRKEATDND